MEPTKFCTGCNTVKPLSHFTYRSTTKDKRQSPCKDCANTASKEARAKKTEALMNSSVPDYSQIVKNKIREEQEKKKPDHLDEAFPSNYDFFKGKLANKSWVPITTGWFTEAELRSARIKP